MSAIQVLEKGLYSNQKVTIQYVIADAERIKLMEKPSRSMLRDALACYRLPGRVVDCQPYGNGHINDTFFLQTLVGEAPADYILQRINTDIFRRPDQLMANITAVTEHLAARIRMRGGDPARETLTVIPTAKGEAYAVTPGGCWRLYLFVTDSVTHETAERPVQLESAGRTFGAFVMDLADFPAATLHETIPLFHHTPDRLRQFREAVAEDVLGRGANVRAEIEGVLAFADETSCLTDRLTAGRLPLRVTHNDTKLNNILFDAATDTGLCVIDLDTVMPGLLAYDFGDAIRVGANLTEESDPDISHVGVSMERFTAFAKGLLDALGDTLTDEEAGSLVTGAKLMTWEVASRFLADYLRGDTYFKIHYPTQNLDRARNQLALVRDIHRHQDELEGVIQTLRRK